MSNALNDAGREEALFSILEVRNDDVRMAVVSALYVVDPGDFEPQNINDITKVLSSCKNIGAGKTEYVLSSIYWICTRFALYNYDDAPPGVRQFQTKFGERVVSDALDILRRNLEHAVSDEDVSDDSQKYTLSIAIVNFLKACTNQEMMQKFLRNGKN